RPSTHIAKTLEIAPMLKLPIVVTSDVASATFRTLVRLSSTYRFTPSPQNRQHRSPKRALEPVPSLVPGRSATPAKVVTSRVAIWMRRMTLASLTYKNVPSPQIEVARLKVALVPMPSAYWTDGPNPRSVPPAK